MDTYKEIMAQKLMEFFEWIGIDPMTGVAILITPVVIWELNKMGQKKEMELYEKLYTVAFWFSAFVVYLGFLLSIFGFFD